MSITKPKAIAALLLALALAGSSSAQDVVEVDAQIPVTVVNTGATVTITPPVGWGTGETAAVTANNERMFNIKLIKRPEPEDVQAPPVLSVSHRPQARMGTGAWVSRNRSNVTLNLQSQLYQNAVISLHSLNGKRILSTRVTASQNTANISRTNISAGVYLLSVKSANGNSYATRITHTGNKLNINVAFNNAANPFLSGSMASVEGGEYGEWTITVTNPGYITQSDKFFPVLVNNQQRSFTLAPVEEIPSGTFTETVNGVQFQMLYVQGGPFRLGCEGGSCPPNTAAVDATVSPYFIGSRTVSRNLWQAVMGGPACVQSQWNDCNGPQGGHTWYDALEFACKLSQMTGKNYRMMTEAEFEFAAKNHTSSMTFGTGMGGEEWAYNTWNETLTGGTDPVGVRSGVHDQKTRRNAQGMGDNITGRLIRSIEGVGPALRLTLSADNGLPPNYIHPCQLPAPDMSNEPVNTYRDMRWVTGTNARWFSSSFGQTLSIMVWEDGTARLGDTPGQWFTSNNINFVFVPSTINQFNTIRRFAYIFLNESVGTYLSPVSYNMGGSVTHMVSSGRIEKEAVSNGTKPAITNLKRGEDLAREQPDFETYYKMVDMVNMPASARGQDERLLDGPEHGWLQINRGSAHHYRKDIDPDEFRFVVSGGMLANGSWFTVNNTLIRITHPGSGNNPQPYVVNYLYVVNHDENSFNHNSFVGYERGDMRIFRKTANNSTDISDWWQNSNGTCGGCAEIAKGQGPSMYASGGNAVAGRNTFVPAPCPVGGCR